MARDEDVSSADRVRDLRLVTYSEALQGTFGRMTPSDWNDLLDSAASLKFNDGQVVLGQATTSKGIYIIAEGRVRIENGDVHAPTPKGAVVLARLEAGEVFGEMSFLEDTGASADVVADGPVEILYISGAKIYDLMAADSGFATRFYESLGRALAGRLRRTNLRVV
jgi:CRP-like cAMP-binding protein